MPTVFEQIVKLWVSGLLSRFILFAFGIALVLMGFYGLLVDFIHNWQIEEFGSFLALFSGAALMIAAYLVYTVIPEQQRRRHYDLLSQHYMGRPKGEIQNINHYIAERTQGIMFRSQFISELVSACAKEDITYEDCYSKMLEAKMMLENIDNESSQIKEYLEKLKQFADAKKH